MTGFHVNPRHVATAPRDYQAGTRKELSRLANQYHALTERVEELLQRVDRLTSRLDAVEAKRKPGRPRKAEASHDAGQAG